MNPEKFRQQFESYGWAPPDVDLEELTARFHEIAGRHSHSDGHRVVARWVLKYWTLRWPDGGLPPA